MPWKAIKTLVHYNTLTQQDSKFINECNRLASHILPCEFIDNAIKASKLLYVIPRSVLLVRHQRRRPCEPSPD
jgi:Zn-dependent peptidase ImmA (M78 family)